MRGERVAWGGSGTSGLIPSAGALLGAHPEAEIREAEGPQVLPVLIKLRELSLAGHTVAARVYLDRVMGPARIHAEDFDAMSEPELEAEICAALGISVEQLCAARQAGPR